MANDVVTLAHGAGGKMSHELMEKVLLPEFGNPLLNELRCGRCELETLAGSCDPDCHRRRFRTGYR